MFFDLWIADVDVATEEAKSRIGLGFDSRYACPSASREISGHQGTWQRLHVSTDDRSMCFGIA